jgi:hypothetical protein
MPLEPLGRALSVGELRNKEERDKQEAVDVMPMARTAVGAHRAI